MAVWVPGPQEGSASSGGGGSIADIGFLRRSKAAKGFTTCRSMLDAVEASELCPAAPPGPDTPPVAVSCSWLDFDVSVTSRAVLIELSRSEETPAATDIDAAAVDETEDG